MFFVYLGSLKIKMTKQFKILLGLCIVFFTTTQCASTPPKNDEGIHSALLTLNGKWRQVQPIITEKDYILEFTPQFYIFYVGGEVPLKKTYHLSEQFIVSQPHKITQIRDTIPFELSHPDTLILDLKEKGEIIKVKHYRIEKQKIIKH